GDIRKGVHSLVVQVRNLAIEFAVFKFTMFAVSTAMEFYAARQAKVAAGNSALEASTTKVGFAMKALPFAIFATGLSYIITKLALSNDLINQQNEGLKALTAKVDKFNQESKKSVNIVQDPNKALIASIDESSQRALASLSSLSQVN